MNFKNVIPFAALLVCSMGNPAQVEARYNTQPPVKGVCNLIIGSDIQDYECTATQESDGAWNVTFFGGSAYVHAPSNEFVMNGKFRCDVAPTISRPMGSGLYITAQCEDRVIFSFPTR